MPLALVGSNTVRQRPLLWVAAMWLSVAVAVWGLQDGLARASGGVLIARIPGGSCGTSYHPGLRFEVLGDRGAEITFLPDRNAYRIQGKVRVVGRGLDRILENGTLIMPGADTSLGYVADGVVILGMLALGWVLVKRIAPRKHDDQPGEAHT